MNQHVVVYIVYTVVGSSLLSSSCKPKYKSDGDIPVLYKFVCLHYHWCWLLQHSTLLTLVSSAQLSALWAMLVSSSTTVVKSNSHSIWHSLTSCFTTIPDSWRANQIYYPGDPTMALAPIYIKIMMRAWWTHFRGSSAFILQQANQS